MNGKKVIAMMTLCAMFCILFAGCGAEANAQKESGNDVWEAQDKLQALTADEITSIYYATYTEGGVADGETSDPAVIEEIRARLCDVKILKESTMGVEDYGLRIEVKTAEESLLFDFEADILVIDSNTRFEVDNLSPVRGYINNLLEE